MLTGRLNQAFFLLASCALAATAHASYGQFRLDGIELFLAFALVVAYGLVVDLALFVRLFQYRAALVVGVVIALGVNFLLLVQAAPPSERAGLFKVYPGGPEQVMLLVTSAVFLPFILIAPFAQYLAMRHGRRWPGWITAWLALQLALLPAFIVLGSTDEHFWKQEYAAGRAVGLEVKAGGLGGIPELADQRHERIWGTGWAYPWRQKTSSGFNYRRSAWIGGLAKGVDGSAPVAANEPLGESDRLALVTMIERYSHVSTVPNVGAKLIWDALVPGGFSRLLAPRGVNEQNVVSEWVIPPLLERLEKHGDPRLCPGARMVDADRAVLNAVILKHGRVWNVEKRADEMHPDWDGYRQRVERLCRGPG